MKNTLCLTSIPELKKIRKAIETLEKLGAKIKAVRFPSLKQIWFAQMTTIHPEVSTIHHENLKNRPQYFGEDVRISLKVGEIPTAVDYLQAEQLRYLILQDFQEAFKSVDVLVTPTLPFVAPEIGKNEVLLNGRKVDFFEQLIRFTIPANSPGIPSISIPCGFADGLPVGMQIMGNLFNEQTILNVAYAFEKTNPTYNAKSHLSISN